MTQHDPRRKKSKDDKRKPPAGRRPPPPEGPPDPDEAAGDDLNVVNLALWAGDFQTANNILGAIALPALRDDPISPFEHPVLASLQRLQAQLERRRNEYTVLATSANLPVALRAVNAPLQSGGGHLRAIIWAESDRDYELRCYLRDLSWEQEFYEHAAELAAAAGVADAPARAALRGYGVEEAHAVADEVGEDDAANDIAWAATVGSMFLQPEVSDFCACSVRGVWTAAELPAQADEVVQIFQGFLNGFDPVAPATGPVA